MRFFILAQLSFILARSVKGVFRSKAEPPMRRHWPLLEYLEAREVPTSYTWWGPASGNQNWSVLANWRVAGQEAQVLPGDQDDTYFDVARDNASFIDAAFQGTVKSINIGSGYTSEITLQRSVTLRGSSIQEDGRISVDAGRTLIVAAGASYTWMAGSITGSGTTRVETGANMTIISTNAIINGHTLENRGILDWNNAVDVGEENEMTFLDGEFVNLGTLNIRNGLFAMVGTGDFTNLGSVNQTNADSRIVVDSIISGNIVVNNVNRTMLFAEETVWDSAIFQGSGSILSNTTLTVSAATTIFKNGIVLSPIEITLNGTLKFQSGARFRPRDIFGTGTAVIEVGAVLDDDAIRIDRATVVNEGTGTWKNSSLHFSNNAKLINKGMFTIEPAAGVSISMLGNGTFANELGGIISKNGTSLVEFDTSALTFTNANVVNVNGGTFAIEGSWVNAGTVSLQGGVLRATGTVTNSGTISQSVASTIFSNTLVNNGTINAGNFQLSILPIPGQSSGGHFTQSPPSGILNLQVTSATTNGSLGIGGTATLDGTLNVTLGNNYQPAGDNPINWTLLNHSARVGQFATVNPPTPNVGAFSGPNYTGTSTSLTWTPPPAIIGLNPNAGPMAGGTLVTINGTNFTGATAVKFGTTAATSFTVVSPVQITATAPAGTGIVDVTVTTPAGSDAGAADYFTYVAAPTVTGVAPSSGPTAGGTVVTITGTDFTGATAVKFGAMPAASFTIVSATQISATAPPQAAGTVDVTVTTVGGTSAISSADQYTYVAMPMVSSISPSMGPTAGGTVVTITGSNFTGATAVKFGTLAAASFTVVSATQITATSPAQTGAVYVTVTTAGGTSSGGPSSQFTYNQPSASINDVTMMEGQGGVTTFTFTVSLSWATTQTVTINYGTANGTAIAPTDYTSASGQLIFNPGETSKTISISVNGDTTQEMMEQFFVNLSGAVNAWLADSQGVGTIMNDDM